VSKRAAPPPSQWRLLGDEFRACAVSTDTDVARISDRVGWLSLRAAKLYATCLEHDLVPPEYQTLEDAKSLRRAIEQDDRFRENLGESESDLSIGEHCLWVGPRSKEVPIPLTAHALAEIAWTALAFELLPARYPDCFDCPSPSDSIVPPINAPDELVLGRLREKARVEADACALLADLCSPSASTQSDRTELSCSPDRIVEPPSPYDRPSGMVLRSRVDGAEEVESAGDDAYKPASYFDKSLGSRLRKAAGPQRKSKRVRSRIIDGTTMYNVEDARRWWPTDVPKE